MVEYQISLEEMRAIRLKEKERERRRIEEYNCYNEELDLWNTTKLAELERERQFREIFERK
jgi:hypothetical protein